MVIFHGGLHDESTINYRRREGRMNDTMRTDSVRLEAENARLREVIEFIRNTASIVLADAPDEILGDTGALIKIATLCDEALLPSGNKSPDPQKIHPNGKQPLHEIDPNNVDYGIFKGDQIEDLKKEIEMLKEKEQ